LHKFFQLMKWICGCCFLKYWTYKCRCWSQMVFGGTSIHAQSQDVTGFNRPVGVFMDPNSTQLAQLKDKFLKNGILKCSFMSFFKRLIKFIHPKKIIYIPFGLLIK